MENKILLSISVPMVEQTYEVFVPVGKTVNHVMKLIEQSVNEMTNGEYKPDVQTKFYNEQGMLIKPNVLIKDSGLINGSNVIII